MLIRVDNFETGRIFSSSPVPVEEILKEYFESKGKGKSEARHQNLDASESSVCYRKRKSSEHRPGPAASSTASSSKISQIKFCSFCNIGMVEEEMEEHEMECWTEQLTAVDPAEDAGV